MSRFSTLGVPDDLVQVLDSLGISKPTFVQETIIPHLIAMDGDLVAQAQPGTGKTAAFGLPLLTKIDPGSSALQGLVLVPTRELAHQIGKELTRYAKFCRERIYVEVISGGVKIGLQVRQLKRPTQIVVATPGRLFDLLKLGVLRLDAMRYLVLDEADRIFDKGFRREVLRIMEMTIASRRSTWLFSETFPEKIERLIADFMSPGTKAVKVRKVDEVNQRIAHRFVIRSSADKDAWVMEFLLSHTLDRGIVFCRTRVDAVRIVSELAEHGVSVEVLHEGLDAKDREKIGRSFKKERTRVLVITDATARDLEASNLSFVIHRQLPEKRRQYAHRMVLAAPASGKCLSICLIELKEQAALQELARKLELNLAPLAAEPVP